MLTPKKKSEFIRVWNLSIKYCWIEKILQIKKTWGNYLIKFHQMYTWIKRYFSEFFIKSGFKEIKIDDKVDFKKLYEAKKFNKKIFLTSF